MTKRHTPLPAIVGQSELKRALLAVATDDALDGLLIRGERGTAKSTAVRALADLLPDQRAVADCPYGCAPDDPDRQCESCRERTDPPVETRPVPLVTLPLGATRERVVGTLSVADALDGDAEFDPGLLARAHRGLLYVDEVNLLDDHLVDVLLDAAAGGVNRVERDGVSVEHPAAFTLIGTMNPEEGELRPQLRDRFALQTTVTGADDVDDRVAIIDRALGADGGGDDPEPLADRYRAETDALRDRLVRARSLLDRVALPREFKAEIAELCRDAGVDGHRGDIATARTARTLAALDGRSKVVEPDVEEAAAFALPHRLQRQPFDDAPDVDEELDDRFGEGDDAGDDGDADDAGDGGGEPDPDRDGSDAGGDGSRGDVDDAPDDADDAPDGPERDDAGSGGEPGDEDGDASRRPAGASAERPGDDDSPDGAGGTPDVDDGDDTDDPDGTASPLVPGERRAGVGDAAPPPVGDVDGEGAGPDGGSRADVDPSPDGAGARVRTERATAEGDVDAAASVRAAAAAGRNRVTEADLRSSVRADSAGALVVFVVDASASMRPAMRAAKGTVLSLLEDAYQQRDEVAFVAAAGDDAEVLLPPTDSVTLAARHLKQLPAGDRTPLPAGLDAATRLLDRERADASVVVVVTDGRANVADHSGSPTRATRAAARRLAATGSSVVVVDAGDDGTGVTDIVERETDARRLPLGDLSAEGIVGAAETTGAADDG
jgi:magnesium chelatase subunit D